MSESAHMHVACTTGDGRAFVPAIRSLVRMEDAAFRLQHSGRLTYTNLGLIRMEKSE